MKKIVHIVLNGIVTDGFSYQDNILPKYHKKNGYLVTIITNEYIYNSKGLLEKTDNIDYYNEDDVHIIRLKIKGDKHYNYKLKKYEKLSLTIEKENPDILFIHGLNYLDIIEIAKYLKNHTNCIAYADNHCDQSNSGRSWLSLHILHGLLWRYTAKRINPYVKKFYGVLPLRVKWLYEIYKLPKEKCGLLVMGADDDYISITSKEKKDVRKKYNIGENDFLVVTGGKIDKSKTETLYLMEAVNRIGGNLKLLVFGSVIDELKEKFDNLCGKNVTYGGWMSNKESYKYFGSADLACFPGRHSVYWEQCVALGTPLMCSDIKDTHHIDIGGNVIFLSSSSKEEIEEKLRTIVGFSDKYKEMLKAANTPLKKQFLYSEIAKKSIEDDNS